MITIPLKKYCDEHSQTAAAKVIGCTQGAVSQMLKAGREIFITTDGQDVSWYEVRRARPQRKQDVAAA